VKPPDEGSPTDADAQPWPPSGPTSSFVEFYRLEMPRVVLFVFKHGATWDDAWDATQSAFVKALQYWDDIDSPSAYVRCTAVRGYRTEQQRTTDAFRRALDADWGHRPAFDSLKIHDEEMEVIEAIAELPYRQREVMAWFFDGFSVSEISDHLGTDANKVSSNLYLARNKLKERLNIAGSERDWYEGGGK
jgi:RNA polymerase sigma factor (sigma-70 family)